MKFLTERKMNIKINKSTLIELAQEFGLPVIERPERIHIVGLDNILTFKLIGAQVWSPNTEETQCQLTEI